MQAQGVRFSDDALQEIIQKTRGYPYFLQEWGYQAWNLASQSPIGIGVVEAATREKQYLRALADLGDTAQRSGDIAERPRPQ